MRMTWGPWCRIPSECNFDLIDGISFNKGCYLGQELTARTQFKVSLAKEIKEISQGQVPVFHPRSVRDLSGTRTRLERLRCLTGSGPEAPAALLHPRRPVAAGAVRAPAAARELPQIRQGPVAGPAGHPGDRCGQGQARRGRRLFRGRWVRFLGCQTERMPELAACSVC
jgi:hypothetical protein